MCMNTCKKMFAAVLAAAAMITQAGITFAEETAVNYVEQSALDSDYDKINVTSYFTRCEQTDYTAPKGTAEENPTYTGISEENVIKFDLHPTQAQAETWQWFRIFLGTKEQLVLNEKNDTVTYNNYSDSSNTYTQSFSYDFANDTETVYNIYIDKRDGNLTFGIKKSTENEYTGIKIDGMANDDYNCIRMRTFGFKTKVSNAYVYTKKVPMPEIAQEVLDGDYGVFDAKDYLFNNGDGYSINNKKTTTYSGLEDEFVLKFRMKPGLQDGSWQNLQIILGSSEKIVINQMTDTVIYKNSKTNISQTIGYDFANDGTAYDVGGTSYDVYISKLNGKLTFGIKQSDAGAYTWFETENAVNDDCTYLQIGTNGYRANLSYANVYTKKKILTVGGMPILTEKEISDKFDTKLKKGSFTFSDSYFEPYCSGFSDYVISFDLLNKSGSPYSGDFMIYLNAPNATQSGGHEYEKITFDPQKLVNDICYASDGGTKKMRFGYDMANESSEIYNVYISKINSEFVFGIKKNGDTEYSWFKTDSTPNTAASNLVFRTTNRGVTVQNLNIYTAKPIVSYVDYTKTANGVKANVNAVRYTDSVKEDVTAVTAVYKVFADGSLQLTDIAQSKPATLERYVNTSFENHVSLPETAENEKYKIVSYLWDEQNGIVPIGVPAVTE